MALGIVPGVPAELLFFLIPVRGLARVVSVAHVAFDVVVAVLEVALDVIVPVLQVALDIIGPVVGVVPVAMTFGVVGGGRLVLVGHGVPPLWLPELRDIHVALACLIAGGLSVARLTRLVSAG
jgi:hypothetical protein